MAGNKEILIVGAGPSGLSMALFLHELGYQPRIVDRKTEISPYSKALGINPRSLQILEPFGVTAKFLANGRKMTAINLWNADRHMYKNDFSQVKSSYPYMLIQPQKESEEILRDEVANRGIAVEYQTEYNGWEQMNNQFLPIISGVTDRSIPYDHIIGADGGHSSVREQLGIAYKGYRYDEQWELYDIEIDMDVSRDEGHIRIFPEGGMIMIRLKDNVWRIAGNLVSILNYLPGGSKTGKVHWESTFRIHHKVAKQLSNDRIALIGDAAHLHSPVGARGMNLGIEDAYLSSRLIHENRLSVYDKIRRPYIESTVNRINTITMGMAGQSKVSSIFRKRLHLVSWAFPIIMPRVRKFVLGLN